MTRKIKFSPFGILFFVKPFDEREESNLAAEKYYQSWLYPLVIVIGAICAGGALFQAILMNNINTTTYSMAYLTVVCGVIMGGLELDSGMSARACNTLYSTAVLALTLRFLLD